MISLKIGAIMAAMFIAGAFVASPELRAYAANTVFSTDIVDGQVMTVDLANNAVTAAKVKDGEIKAPEIATNAVGASEIATDAVGAAELQGVTKLLFGKCVLNNEASTLPISSGANLIANCNINGVDTNDRAIAMLTEGNNCFDLRMVETVEINAVAVTLYNECSFTTSVGTRNEVSIIVFDK
jgi:hypothetical protein